MVADARTTKRQLTNRAGTAKAGDKEVTVVLRNMSVDGACVRPVGSGSIPDRFRLVAPMEKIDAQCRVIWRRGRDCGVKFEEPAEPAS